MYYFLVFFAVGLLQVYALCNFIGNIEVCTIVWYILVI